MATIAKATTGNVTRTLVMLLGAAVFLNYVDRGAIAIAAPKMLELPKLALQSLFGSGVGGSSFLSLVLSAARQASTDGQSVDVRTSFHTNAPKSLVAVA